MALAITAAGMVTCVGLNAAASCAAIRCAIDNFTETRFMDRGGEWIMGGHVPLDQPWRGLSKLVHMAVPAIRECLEAAEGVRPEKIPLLLCVAEKERPGRLEGLDDRLMAEIQREFGLTFHPRSAVIAKGRVGGALAMELAGALIHQEKVPYCVITGVDSFLVAGTLAAYERQSRLLTSQNSNGFIPGEAGAAVLVGPPDPVSASPRLPSIASLLCLGLGRGEEKATIDSEEPLRGDGLAAAIRAAFSDAEKTFADVDFRITDANGEQYWFKEAALALTRVLRVRKEAFDIWHPADCTGETGAAASICALGVILAAARKDWLPGPGVLCHFGADDGERVALVLRHGNGRAA